MARFKNFSIWRGRLPHWRADGETYYVTFRHTRPLTEEECGWLVAELLRSQGRKLDYLAVVCLPEASEMLFQVQESPAGEPYELSDVIEKAKRKVAKRILAATGERRPPFYHESYDRIVRDEQELEERFLAILESPVKAELVEDAELWAGFWFQAND